LEYQINNLSSQASSAGHVGYFLSETQSFSKTAILLTYASLPDSVPANSSTPSKSIVVALPRTIGTGTYYIIVVVNYDGAISEPNYANNASNALPIVVGASAR
jgi:hypothetical protein